MLLKKQQNQNKVYVLLYIMKFLFHNDTQFSKSGTSLQDFYLHNTLKFT